MTQTTRRQMRRMGRKAIRALAIRPGARFCRRRNQWTGRAKGARRLMEPKLMTSPRGSAPMRVMKNSWRVLRNPLFRADSTV